ncbi:hypothetical protein ACFOYU_16295 [Microvirga sp. GCM10011540]|uniref:hypothetical protein n=1 Tax=Microvirga sp. GCM10011540 TaxID=3317338 RepID=UPI00361AF327
MFWNKKKDHSATIEKIALSLIESKQETGVLPFLSLKEAADYAKDKSPLHAPGFVQCHAVIGSGYYNLEFKLHPDKGVYMSAYYYGEASDIGGMASGLKGSRGWK